MLSCVAGTAQAAEILVTSDITTSQTWTPNNTYNLQNQIYVRNGATLTIEAGTVVASTPTANGSGSLAVTRGSQIFVSGTAADPVIMTSTADVATWTAGNPKTGVWREAANEWGNLTIMGNAFISEDMGGDPGTPNVATCSASNRGAMEGLVPAFAGDPNTLYGGGDDDDDSGKISYLSIRYGGRVVGLANELNGLSLGGIGRGTDIDHVEIMNNVDDGIEIWGGTVGLKYITIWNIGDDSFDIDQGWRGKAQFIFIVQGYSLDASQGSGVGDNCFETDGAEDSDYQPVTTGVIYNATVIGEPNSGDGATAWRDNARIQYRNCLFMDNAADQLVRFDNVDGDGGSGYGHNGTLSWADTWTTSFSQTSTVNACSNPSAIYTAQVDGNLAEITDSVFYNVGSTTEATARGVLPPNATNNNAVDTSLPITTLVRASAVTRGGLTQERVISVDPRPATANARTSVGSAPDDGFFCPAGYRGAFSDVGLTEDAGSDHIWVCGWTAQDAYGFISTPSTVAFRNAAPNPVAYTARPMTTGCPWTATVDRTVTGKFDSFVFAFDTPVSVVLGSGQRLLAIDFGSGELLTGGGLAPAFSSAGIDSYLLPIPANTSLVGLTFYSQSLHAFPAPFVLSNAQDITVGL